MRVKNYFTRGGYVRSFLQLKELGMDAAPIIIKRKRGAAAEGHHGGAWKVAYADFVTAMMAFFLLMWLLNATTEEQRKGIADYFDLILHWHCDR